MQINSLNKNEKCKENKIQLNTNSINNKILLLLEPDKLNIILSIIPYLTYKELIYFSNINKSFYKLLRSHKSIKSYVINSKMQPENRSLFYATNLNIAEMKLKIKNELNEYNIEDNFYQKILNLTNDSYNNNKKFKKICDEIDRDLHRTFNIEKFVKGNGKLMLKNILRALAFVRPEIGYCQGMNFIGGALINLIDNEEKSFWVFLCFIDNIQLNLLFLNNMPDFLIRVYQLKKCMELYFPKLYRHLRRNKINIDLFFSKWFLTIFSNYFPFDVLYQVWDLFIIDKWKSLFKFSMIIFFYMKEDLMKMDLNKFIIYFQTNEMLTSLTFEQMIKYYNDYKITNKKLEQLREEFFITQVENKLNNPNTEWEDDQKEYVFNYRKELENYLNKMKEPMEILENKIEKINKEYENKLEKYDKQFDIVTNLEIEINMKIEVKTGYENILKNSFDNNKNENNTNNEGFIGSVLKIFNYDNSENAKIQKKIKDINKIIDEKKKLLNNSTKILDEYKNKLDICKKEQNTLKEQYQNMEKDIINVKKDLLKNLSQKLKLSAKFVATSKY